VFISSIIDVVETYQKTCQLDGIALSMPGFIDINTGFASEAGAIDCMWDTNIKTQLQAHTDLPIEIENDANCVAMAEKFLGAALDCEHFVCITVGTGIGGGIFVNGKIYRGHTFGAGEFGYMNTAAYKGTVTFPDLSGTGATSALIGRYKEYKNIPKDTLIEGIEVFEQAKRDTGVQQIIEDWYLHLSQGIYNLVCTLNPQKILIGGSISARGEELTTNLEKYLCQMPSWALFDVSVELCHFKEEAGLMGAIYHFFEMQNA